jgi:ABC-2 type transport system ATP-binding protein
MSIIATNISKLFGEQKALDDVSFEIKSGEIVGFLGPNGAGKSTMMKILTCFLPPSSGEATVCGFNILEQSLEVRKKVGYLPENNPLYSDMFIREYLEFVAGLYKLGRNSAKRINEMIEITGLKDEIKKKIGALSKGFRQRVGLAQALIHNPEVLILDEPTSGLDPNQIIEIRNLIKEIGKKKTIMLSTHIMQEVEAICGRVMIIDKGKIIADKQTAEIHKIAGSQQTIIVEFNAKTEAVLLKQINGVEKALNVNDNIWHLTTDSAKDIREEVFKFAVKSNIAVLSMKVEENSLEEVFHHLTMK